MFILIQGNKCLAASNKKASLKYFAQEYAFCSDPSEVNRHMTAKSPEKAWEQKYKNEFNIIEIPFAESFSYTTIQKIADKNNSNN